MVNPSLVKVLEAADQLSAQLNRNRALFEKVIQKAQAVKENQETRESSVSRSNSISGNQSPVTSSSSQSSLQDVFQPLRSTPEIVVVPIPSSKTPEDSTAPQKPKEVAKEKEKEPEKDDKDKDKDKDKEKEVVVDEAMKKKLEEMTQENLELVDAIKEYQETLELIMSKHRALMGNLQAERESLYEETRMAIAVESRKSEKLQIENYQLRNKIAEMLDVMRRAVGAEDDELEMEIEIEALQKENEGLRQMLAITQQAS